MRKGHPSFGTDLACTTPGGYLNGKRHFPLAPAPDQFDTGKVAIRSTPGWFDTGRRLSHSGGLRILRVVCRPFLFTYNPCTLPPCHALSNA